MPSRSFGKRMVDDFFRLWDKTWIFSFIFKFLPSHFQSWNCNCEYPTSILLPLRTCQLSSPNIVKIALFSLPINSRNDLPRTLSYISLIWPFATCMANHLLLHRIVTHRLTIFFPCILVFRPRVSGKEAAVTAHLSQALNDTALLHCNLFFLTSFKRLQVGSF